MALRKCQHAGCYEPVDCIHGFCHTHCPKKHVHKKRDYNARSKPKNSWPHIGIEIECVFKNAVDEARALSLAPGCKDGSLPSCGAEFKMLKEDKHIIVRASRLVEDLWRLGAKVTKQCGLHVHLDTRGVSEDRITKMIAWAKLTQDIWFSLVPPTRRSNGYCRRLNGDSRDDRRHYAWIHPTTYKTVEVRLHAATLNSLKLKGWLTALIHLRKKMADTTFAFPTLDSYATIEAAFWKVFEDCPKDGLDYLKTRRANGGIIHDYAFRSREE